MNRPCSNSLKFTSILALQLFLMTAANAATIVVDATDGTVADDGQCSISEAILAANSDTSTGTMPGECPAGSGADEISLTSNVTLSLEYAVTYGTPEISSTITLNGHGYKIERNSNLTCNLNLVNETGEFRLLAIGSSANLTLRNIVLENGCIDSDNMSGSPFRGGAIYNSGNLSIENSSLLSNRGHEGGAIYNSGTISLLKNVNFELNQSQSGGGILNASSINQIINVTFTKNSANSRGGAIYNYSDGNITLISNSTFSENTASKGAGIYHEGFLSFIDKINNSSFVGNSTNANLGSAIYIEGLFVAVENSLFYNNYDELNPPTMNEEVDCYLDPGSSPIVSGSNNMSNLNASNCNDNDSGVDIIDSESLTDLTVNSLLSDHGCVNTLPGGNCVKTHALLMGSEAINTSNANSTEKDQRGYSPADGMRDVGAYEYNGINLIFKNGFELP